MSLKTSIGWTDMTCNPIKGICKGGCWYCWTKPLYVMKRLTPEIRLRLSAFDALPKKVSKKVFLCSTHDLFGSWISEHWRDLVFYHIEKFPQHTFQILTKFPQNIDREMPDNVWLGITIEDDSENSEYRLAKLYGNENIREDQILFLSVEPMLGIPDIPHIEYFDWLIIGRLTGHGKKYNPKKKHIEWLINNYKKCRRRKAPVFLKDNLRGIWGPDLIQEFPG